MNSQPSATLRLYFHKITPTELFKEMWAGMLREEMFA